jgi:hypothetical protein
VRKGTWARDYLARFAEALETRPLLCALSPFPENSAAYAITADADACRIISLATEDKIATHLKGTEKRIASAVAAYAHAGETACIERANDKAGLARSRKRQRGFSSPRNGTHTFPRLD